MSDSAEAVLPLLGRLNDFFCEGVNTDAVADFFRCEEGTVAKLMDAASTDDDGELNTDSPFALELFALYQRYASRIEQLIAQFVEREAARGETTSLEGIAHVIMEEMETPDGATRYLCTAYIAGALDMESFLELAEEMHEVATYEVVQPVSAD